MKAVQIKQTDHSAKILTCTILHRYFIPCAMSVFNKIHEKCFKTLW